MTSAVRDPWRRSAGWVAILACVFTAPAISCARPAPAPPIARNLVLITIDTLRADHIGAYGYRRPTPALDRMANAGVLFRHAYAAAPITLPSHATILTGRYPPRHGARDNGIRMGDSVPTLATVLHSHGFKTAAFVAAFPLDHQFGLARGFDVYGDRLPRGPDGRSMNERPGSEVVDEAMAWLRSEHIASGGSPPFPGRFFLWVHLFEPHAPYGDPSSGQPAIERYDDEIATADRQVGRLLDALSPVLSGTLVVVAGDHGEAFGEHGEIAHSIFVYDTTLRVPFIMSGPGAPRARNGRQDRHVVVESPVTLADLAPTAARLVGEAIDDVDGIDLTASLDGGTIPSRELYAESFAPLVEFGWAPLRAIRSGPWKFIAAPTAELYDLENDPDELTNLAVREGAVAHRLEAHAGRYGGATLAASPGPALSAEAGDRLRALGYASGPRRDEGGPRPDPKDRREIAARIAEVTSGELTGAALAAALEAIVRDDPRNGQARLRLAYARLQAGDCPSAEKEFHAALANNLRSADIYLGLATCLGRRNDLAGAGQALEEARRLEPDNPVITANIGILHAAKGETPAAIELLRSALTRDPDLHEARFNLAVAYLKAGRRAEAAASARELLARLPQNAPQRSEVERLLRAAQ